MGFPFIAPLKPEIVKKLKNRENNLHSLNLLSPFIMLSSAAVVSNSGLSPKEIMGKSDYSNAYKGCVVTNTTDVTQMYQTAETIVGYDLDGTAIKVLNEKGRRISTPIITQMELDTDGNNNTLKTAKLDIKVFSLKQLEMFELFFLRPGMKVVLEWGWNVNIQNKNKINSKLFAKKDFTTYVKDFTEIFSHKENAYKIAKEKYLKILEDTNYDYDFMAGNVTGFTFSPDTDGTYNINLEISAGNELQLWMPLKQAQPSNKGKKTSNNAKVSNGFETWVNKICADLNTLSLANVITKKDDEKEFFNWGVFNEKQQDSTFNKDEYVSFRLLLKILNNMVLWKESDEHIKAVYEYEGKEIIPISSAPYIISTNTDFILPGELPAIKVITDTDKKDKIVIEKDNGNIKTISCPINEYSFNITKNKTAQKAKIKSKASKTKEDNKTKGNTPSPPQDDKKKTPEEEYHITTFTGNLLNVFFKWKTFVKIFNESYTQADVVNALLGIMNDNMFGLCKLELGKPDDFVGGTGFNTIIDKKLLTPPPENVPEEVKKYRFNIGANGSIVRDFTFNMELSALAQAQALYSTQLAINAAKNNKDITTESVADKAYKNASFQYTPNADGYYSINAIEVALEKDREGWNKTLKENLNVTKITEEGTGQKEKINMNEVLSQNFVKFKLKKDSKTPDVNHLIYTDKSLIQSEIPVQPTQTTALTFLEITFGIDGLSGLSCGEYFLIDGVPEIYNRNGYFQIVNVKHGLNEDGWKTTIVAQYRIEVKPTK